MFKEYLGDLKKEFSGYNRRTLFSDILAGVTVAAVALPLALAFGVTSGADASAGLITAVIAAFVIGMLSGASFQISGPTGAMAVILLPLAAKYGLSAVFAAGLLSGVILIVAGLLKAGHVITFIPKAVITGFTTGIALLLALGQIENLLGVTSHGELSFIRVINIIADGLVPNLYSIGIGLAVIVFIFSWPKKWGSRVPASLLAVILALAAQMIFVFPIDTIGTIPQTLFHETRFMFSDIFDINFEVILLPAISIAALCMIESLLCGAVGGKIKKEKLRNNREIVAQGIGNVVLPFFGGVPATAAIARTSVAIRAGARTRVTGLVQGVILLLSMFLLAPFMSSIPMSALAGVLIVTAWRMNEWHAIKYMFNKKFASAIISFFITVLCTVVFDLTVAILVGCTLSLLVYIVRVSDIEVMISEFDAKRAGSDIKMHRHVQIVYITGSIFFGSAEKLVEKMQKANGDVLVLSMRGVPNVDISGGQEILDFCNDKKKEGKSILFCGIQPKVKHFFDKSGVTNAVGEASFFWEAKDALKSLATSHKAADKEMVASLPEVVEIETAEGDTMEKPVSV